MEIHTKILAALAVLSLTTAAQAQIGWTLAECQQNYGKESESTESNPRPSEDPTRHNFDTDVHGVSVSVEVVIPGTVVNEVHYSTNNRITKSWVSKVLHENVSTKWTTGATVDDILAWNTECFRASQGFGMFHGRGYWFLDIFSKDAMPMVTSAIDSIQAQAKATPIKRHQIAQMKTVDGAAFHHTIAYQVQPGGNPDSGH